MTYKSIKLLALAVICGCSLLGFAIVPNGGDGRILLFLLVILVTGSWFVLYWFLCEDRRR